MNMYVKPIEGNVIGQGIGEMTNMLIAKRKEERDREERRAKLLLDQRKVDVDESQGAQGLAIQGRQAGLSEAKHADDLHRRFATDFDEIWKAAGGDPMHAAEMAKARGLTIDLTDPMRPLAVPDVMALPDTSSENVDPGPSPGHADQAAMWQRESQPAMQPTPQAAPPQEQPVDAVTGASPIRQGGPAPYRLGEDDQEPIGPLAPRLQPTPHPGMVFVSQEDHGFARLEGDNDEEPFSHRLPPGAKEGDWIPDPRIRRGGLPKGDDVANAIGQVGADARNRMAAPKPRMRFDLGEISLDDAPAPQAPAPQADVRRMPAPTVEGFRAEDIPPEPAPGGGFRIKGPNGEWLTVDPRAARGERQRDLDEAIKLKSAGPEASANAMMQRRLWELEHYAELHPNQMTAEEREKNRDLSRRNTDVGANARLGAARIMATGTAAPTPDDEIPPFGSKAGNQRLDAEGKLDNIVQKVITNTGYKAEAVQNRKFNQMATVFEGARDNSALASAGAGFWVKQAQGGVGVLSDKDMTVFWDRIGGVPDRIENYITNALTGKMGAERQATVADAVKQLAGTARAQLQAIGEQVKTRLSGVDYVTPEVIDRYIDTYVPGLNPPRRPTAPLHSPGRKNPLVKASPLQQKAQKALDDPNAPPEVKAAARRLLEQ